MGISWLRFGDYKFITAALLLCVEFEEGGGVSYAAELHHGKYPQVFGVLL